jgi:hypothetical protein
LLLILQVYYFSLYFLLVNLQRIMSLFFTMLCTYLGFKF